MAHKKYTVKQGDCIASIAFKHGMFPDTIWDDSKNSDLKKKRKDINVLLPGDELYIRGKEEKEESCASEERHRFRRKGVPEILKLQLLYAGKPRAEINYTIIIDGISVSGATDEEGRLEHPIPPDAKEGELILGEDEKYQLFLGNLDPIHEVSGVQGRLRNLGFYNGSIDGELTDETVQAIQDFQVENELEPTGEPDSQTLDMLKKRYGG
jgi:hypothetical protein